MADKPTEFVKLDELLALTAPATDEAENPLAAEPELPSISDEELQERLAALGHVASCGPQCASSALATRYAKILRQERLLAMSASALKEFADATEEPTLSSAYLQRIQAASERAGAIRRQIDQERREP